MIRPPESLWGGLLGGHSLFCDNVGNTVCKSRFRLTGIARKGKVSETRIVGGTDSRARQLMLDNPVLTSTGSSVVGLSPPERRNLLEEGIADGLLQPESMLMRKRKWGKREWRLGTFLGWETKMWYNAPESDRDTEGRRRISTRGM